jgi:hypothetical protein
MPGTIDKKRNNMTVLDQNVANYLELWQYAPSAYMKARDYLGFEEDRKGYKAEAFAQEVAKLEDVLWPVISARLPEGKAHKLMQFILKRHWHYRFPNAKH